MIAIVAVWSESLWGLRKITGNQRRRQRSSNGGRRHDKSSCISVTKVSFSTIILILCHYNREKQISGRARGAPGLPELEQLHTILHTIYLWSQTVDICLYRNSTIVSHSQRLGYKRAGPSGLAELEQLHVESNSECNRHVYLSSTLASSLS